MGTNFYAERTKCEACGSMDYVHIGKRSAGWRFTLHIPNGSGEDSNFPGDMQHIQTAEDWIEAVKAGTWEITDEYGAIHTPDEMFAVIMSHADRPNFHDGDRIIYGMPPEEGPVYGTSSRGFS